MAVVFGVLGIIIRYNLYFRNAVEKEKKKKSADTKWWVRYTSSAPELIVTVSSAAYGMHIVDLGRNDKSCYIRKKDSERSSICTGYLIKMNDI